MSALASGLWAAALHECARGDITIDQLFVQLNQYRVMAGSEPLPQSATVMEALRITVALFSFEEKQTVDE
jgi:hypothetical protein